MYVCMSLRKLCWAHTIDNSNKWHWSIWHYEDNNLLSSRNAVIKNSFLTSPNTSPLKRDMSTEGVERNNFYFAPKINDSINFLCEIDTNTRHALFWDITQRIVVIPYRPFRTTNQSHLQVSRNPNFSILEDGSDRFPEMSVRNYHYSCAGSQKTADHTHFAAEVWYCA
jgi:hypothetical protein